MCNSERTNTGRFSRAFALVLYCHAKRLAEKISRHFAMQSEVSQKPIVTLSHNFSRASRRLNVRSYNEF